MNTKRVAHLVEAGVPRQSVRGIRAGQHSMQRQTTPIDPNHVQKGGGESEDFGPRSGNPLDGGSFPLWQCP
jgi:hypothetical protein